MTGPRVQMFIDYQNLHMSAGEAFAPPGTSPRDTLVHPGLFADEVMAVRDSLGKDGTLEQIRVYRGQASPTKQKDLAAATEAQASHWSRDPRVRMHRRTLRYPRDWPTKPAREKGVDVMLAINLVSCALAGDAEVVILVSRDTDLVPALEMVRDVTSTDVEVAGWSGTSRLRLSTGPPLWCTYVDGSRYPKTRDRRPYWPQGS